MSWLKTRCVFGLLAYFVLLHHCRCVHVDPCTNYKTLSHDNRVLTPLSASTSAEECDHYLEPNWYRIDGNVASDLVNRCPDLGQCGTLFPVWLNGSTPSESDGIVDRIACKRGLSDAACCETPINIKLKNCGLFRVAYLEPLSGCPGKYCFEFNELCPPGQTSNSGFKPCTVKIESKILHLVDGNSLQEGRVELLHDGKWGTICSHFFDDIDATVICKMLGYDETCRCSGSPVFYRVKARSKRGVARYVFTLPWEDALSPGKSKALKNFGGGTGPIWFDDPECKGTETDIADCQRMFRTPVPIWGIKTCHHREDVGVRCGGCKSRKPIIIG